MPGREMPGFGVSRAFQPDLTEIGTNYGQLAKEGWRPGRSMDKEYRALPNKTLMVARNQGHTQGTPLSP